MLPLVLFGTAFTGGVGLFAFYKPHSNTTIRFARARILAQGSLIVGLTGMAILGLTGNDGKKKYKNIDESVDLSKRRF